VNADQWQQTGGMAARRSVVQREHLTALTDLIAVKVNAPRRRRQPGPCCLAVTDA
jgi:hypothetical protein